MSGAAGISAAKNRRSKQPQNSTPTTIISCSNVNKSPPPPSNVEQSYKHLLDGLDSRVVNQETLQILGPMPPLQILRIHEQRLNKLDDSFRQSSQTKQSDELSGLDQHYDEACYDKIDEMEVKIRMLEEVIMNLQLTLTNVQNFAMETSLNLTKLQKTTNLIVTIPTPDHTM